MYACMSVCMQGMYVCMYACMCVHVCVCMYVCTHVMYACVLCMRVFRSSDAEQAQSCTATSRDNMSLAPTRSSRLFQIGLAGVEHERFCLPNSSRQATIVRLSYLPFKRQPFQQDLDTKRKQAKVRNTGCSKTII